jgi:hypothetical protein
VEFSAELYWAEFSNSPSIGLADFVKNSREVSGKFSGKFSDEFSGEDHLDRGVCQICNA